MPDGWHPGGIMAAVPDINAAAAQSTLGGVMTPEQMADVDWGAEGPPDPGPAFHTLLKKWGDPDSGPVPLGSGQDSGDVAPSAGTGTDSSNDAPAWTVSGQAPGLVPPGSAPAGSPTDDQTDTDARVQVAGNAPAPGGQGDDGAGTSPVNTMPTAPIAVASAVPDHRFYSATGGIVKAAGWENPQNHKQGYGYRIQVQGDNGHLFIYGHADPGSAQVQPGDRVQPGQALGDYADPTNGRSDGPHTHLEERDPSQPLQQQYAPYIHNSRALGAVIDPTPYAGIVMPGGGVRSPFLKRTFQGKTEFHPGVDLSRHQGN